MRIFLFALLSLLAALSANAQDGAGVIEGRLSFDTHGGDTFFCINVTRPVKMDGLAGNVITARKLQIAGLDEIHWNAAKSLIGKKVRVHGRLMEPHTRYHHTPILVIADGLAPL